MIVICAWCHKVFREYGETQWKPIGDRPLDESKASHGMCPPCFGGEVAELSVRHGSDALRRCST